ncbi:transcriptional repressor NF-X1 [Sporothrix schenckii 1099-18]|uniref:Transcriptional repressor NF-X1 n=1 Tax=Sporothrix schenckii 1099-18 TaxID=1397361 RepID=A0A0F2MC89_SPOSC|nr:transcriptional repressor NF-X1 [Sporothrix schenckii 1099-18]KJR85776.1 transcriptional repressor NF-X1 [Sporothrix schenckii 1099-18]
MSAPTSGLNPTASSWAPQASSPGASTASPVAQGTTQGVSHQLPSQPPQVSQQDGVESRQGAARGRRQRPPNDAGRGRGSRPPIQQNRPVVQQRPPALTQQPIQQQAQQEAQQESQLPERGRGGRGGRGGAARGGRGGRGRGSLIAPPRMFGDQLSGPQAPANGHETPQAQPHLSRRALARAARAADQAARPPDLETEGSAAGSVSSYGAPRVPPSTAPDLPTRMHEDIDSGNYDCPICLNAVTRGSKIWACSMCYHVAHYTCVSAWVKQALNQGLALEKIRCPACNTEAAAAAVDITVPRGNDNGSGTGGFFGRKLCWCGKQKTAGVAPAALAPHSCGRICGRARADCHHTCPSPCHAGPCPPCPEMGPLVTCFCGKETSTKPCAAGVQRSWTCGAICDNTLACRMHKCQRTCHPDDCGACTVPLASTCFCGKTRQDIPCKAREPAQSSANYGQLVYGGTSMSSFEGTFRCDTVCGRAFDCGKHFCKKPCHAQDATPTHCPASPEVITHCLCGKTLLGSAGGDDASPARTSCEDPIPACDKVCGKALDCGHSCPATCHAGACPPCAMVVNASCACGQMSSPVVCSDRAARDDVQCETVCRSWLSCRQHRCNIVCCPGKPKAAARMKQPKGRNAARGSAAQDEIEAEHTCLRPCGRLLKCGQHTCPQVCHKGACHSCVAYVLEDMSCPCGQTVVSAPYLCGTVLPACDADCPRPLPCGHPSIPHRCHDSQQQPCPRCQRLVSKSCLCGKLVLNRVACGADNIQCSNICGKTLKCGVHACRLPCHAKGKCEDTTEVDGDSAVCSQVCGRPKATCGHPCANPCHGADDVCSEVEPCGAAVEVTCPCQRQTRKVRCNVCTADPTPTHRRPECDDECLRIQRNAQLKDALRISDDYKDEHLVYSTALMEYFMANRDFATAQEDKIRAFFTSTPSTPAEPSGSVAVSGADKACIFKPMKRHERQFLHMLAESFNLRSESRDVEPHRYVFLTRPRTGTPAVPDISLAESEEIYLHLRDKAEAEEAEREAEVALAASLKAKEAAQEAALDDAFRPAERRRPYNAIFVPAALAAAVTAENSDKSSNINNADTATILDNDAFQTIVEAWHEQQQQERRWAPSSGLGSSTSPMVAAALHQHTVQPSGDVILRVLIPAAAPAVVQQLLLFLLSYMNAWWSPDTGSSKENRPALCHVDAQYNILRRGTKQTAAGSNNANTIWDDDDDNDDDNNDDQWNIVAGTSSASRQAATPVNNSASDTSGPERLPSAKRVVFKLRQKQKTASMMTTAAAQAERKRWLAILAQQATDEEKAGETDKTDKTAAGEEQETDDETQKVVLPHGDETKEREETEELRTALERALLADESTSSS